MSKSVVVLPLGRFQPPHKEHKNLVDAVLKLAKQTHSDAKIFVSRTVDKKKNPLTPQEKIKFLNKMFPGHKGLFDMPPASTPTMIGSLAELSGKYDTVHIVLGDDRVDATETLVNKYNRKDFTFEKIVVHSRHSIINTRVGDADGVHASDIRKWAQEGDFDKVRAEMSSHLSDADVREIIKLTQARLGKKEVKEDINLLFAGLFEEDDIEDDIKISLPSTTEIDKHLDSVSNDDLDLHDDDWVVADIIVGPEMWNEDELTEVVSIQNRQRRSQRFKSMSKRLSRLRKIKAKQMPQGQRLRQRSRKAALMMLRARATGKKNLNYATLSRGQKIAVDTALIQRFGSRLSKTVDAYAKRIFPRVRAKAMDSVKKARESHNNVNELFSRQIQNKIATDKAQDKVQAAKRGISVSDWEKSKADKAHDSPLNVDANKLDNLNIDPTMNDRDAPNPKQSHLNRNHKLHRSVDEGRKSSSDKDARDAGDTNIIYQMRKTINSRGEHETVFTDGHKAHISIPDAKKLLAKFEALRLPADKHKFTIAAAASIKGFRDIMAHGIPKDKPKISLGGKSFREFYTGPETRRIAEADDSDANKSRAVSPKLNLLLRLGLADTDELQDYRRALRSSKKVALQSPQMREKLADLLDKLIDLTTNDPTTYSRIRHKITTKEDASLMRKAETSGVDIEIVQEVFARGLEEDDDVNKAFARVNSFIAGGFAAKLDEDCWKGYKAIGLKKKNGKNVPNCVPEEETRNEGQANWDKAHKDKERSSVSYLNYTKKSYVDRKYTPMKIDLVKTADSVRKAFLSKGGTIQKIAPGKKSIKSYVRPKTYMTPNQASRVTEELDRAFESYTGSEPVSKNKNDPANRFVGTDAIVKNYADATPGQSHKFVVADHASAKPDFGGPETRTSRKAVDADQSKKNLESIRKALSGIREAYDLNRSFEEATYKGKIVALNKPTQGDVKKSKVYVDPDGDGIAKKVNFGDKTLSIKKDQPARKRSYCARSSGQGNLTNKSSANYWSRRAWDC